LSSERIPGSIAHSMDTTLRLLGIAALIGWSVLRVVRYFRYGMAKRVTAVPPSGGMPMPNTAHPVAAESQTTSASGDSGGRSVQLIAGLTVVIVWAGANMALLFVLFGLPALAQVPLIWRLFVAVFANFYLLPFARGLGESQKRKLQARSTQVDNPFKS